MTLNELKQQDLRKIHSKYFYLPGEEINIFVGTKSNIFEYVEFEPISLKVLLIELSSYVYYNNNFSSVAESLNLPQSLIIEAENMDRAGLFGYIT